jgi:hypothetical protein
LMYELRLASYFCIGVCLNLCAWISKGLDWEHNMFNVVFQMWFVFGLMLFGLLLAPLKTYLQWVTKHRTAPNSVVTPWRSERDSLFMQLAIVASGLLGMIFLFNSVLMPVLSGLSAPYFLRIFSAIGCDGNTWGLPVTLPQANDFVQHLLTYTLITCSNVYLIMVLPILLRDASLTSWALLINIYSHRALVPIKADERPWHFLDLFMLSMACCYLGIWNRRKMGDYVVRYWFVILILCGVLWPPTVHDRLDMHPPTLTNLRIRYALIEFLLVGSWLVAGDRLWQREIFSVDKLTFLNEWALLVFLVHKAAELLLGSPDEWFFIFGLAPALCVARMGMST